MSRTDFNDITTFLAVAHEGSFTNADGPVAQPTPYRSGSHRPFVALQTGGFKAVEHYRKKMCLLPTVDLVHALEHETAMIKAGQLEKRLLRLDLIITPLSANPPKPHHRDRVRPLAVPSQRRYPETRKHKLTRLTKLRLCGKHHHPGQISMKIPCRFAAPISTHA